MARNPLELILSGINSLKYTVRCFLFPHNVVRIDYLPRTWCDRDTVMLHAIFQILVDFVELEQPFKDWKSKDWSKRHTDRAEMRAYLIHYLDETTVSDPDADPEMQAHWIRELGKQLVINREILYLYEWYKDEKFELDKMKLYEATGEKLVLADHSIDRVKTGKPQLITWDELHAIEEEHDIMCNAMLRRVLNVREYLWT